MASSAPASSKPIGSESLARFDATFGSGLIRFLTTPAAFFAANWAAILLLLTVVGVVPALAGATRVTTRLGDHADRAFTTVLRHGARTFRRDLPISIALWAVVALVIGDALILARLAEGSTLVFLTGLTLPAIWGAIAFLSAYVAVAGALNPATDRAQTLRAAVSLVVTRPLRALLAPAAIVAVSPLWLLAPLTIAIGFSLPPFLIAHIWGPVFPAAEPD